MTVYTLDGLSGLLLRFAKTAALPEQGVWSQHGPSNMQKLACCLLSSSLNTNAACYSEAAATAEGVGGWPPPEMAAIDATLQQQWWTAPVLARFEGAISSLCLPGMSASLGASPHQGTSAKLILLACASSFVCVHVHICKRVLTKSLVLFALHLRLCSE